MPPEPRDAPAQSEAARSTWSARLVPLRLLPVVIVWLLVTTGLKSFGLISAAFAQHPAQSAAAAGQSAMTPSQSTKPDPNARAYRPVTNWTDRPPPPPLCKPPSSSEAGENGILLQLKHREAALDARAARLARQQQELDATKAALEQQVAAFKPLAARLLSLDASRRSKDHAKWTSLVATYEAMEPRSAARIFDGLQPNIVFNVLRRMNNRKSAAILADMVPVKAQHITERLAGRHVRPSVRPANALLPDGAP